MQHWDCRSLCLAPVVPRRQSSPRLPLSNCNCLTRIDADKRGSIVVIPLLALFVRNSALFLLLIEAIPRALLGLQQKRDDRCGASQKPDEFTERSALVLV